MTLSLYYLSLKSKNSRETVSSRSNLNKDFIMFSSILYNKVLFHIQKDIVIK